MCAAVLVLPSPRHPYGEAAARAVDIDVMEHDITEPVAGTYPGECCLALLTDTEARGAIEYLQLLEQLDPDGRGPAAGQLAADLARRLPAR